MQTMVYLLIFFKIKSEVTNNFELVWQTLSSPFFKESHRNQTIFVDKGYN